MSTTIDVAVELPRLVADACDAPRRAELALDPSEADTDGVLAALFATYPGVRAHLVDDRGELRSNVLCALDGERTRLDRSMPVDHGSTLRFVPSVAGG
jgi:hypothetical protein